MRRTAYRCDAAQLSQTWRRRRQPLQEISDTPTEVLLFLSHCQTLSLKVNYSNLQAQGAPTSNSGSSQLTVDWLKSGLIMITKQNQRIAILFLCFCCLSLQKADAFGVGHSLAPTGRMPVLKPRFRKATERSVFSEVLMTVESFYVTSPYVAAALTCGVKASAADFIAQKRQIRKREEAAGAATISFQAARNVAFLFYGALYQGMAQEFIYNHLYPIWFGTSSMPLTVLKKMLFDVFIQTPLFTLPFAYFFKAIIFQHSPKEAIRRYTEDVMRRGLLKKYVLLWAPVQCLTFSVVPPHLRISFIAFVSFFWLIIFSSVTGKRQEVEIRESDTCDLIDGTTCNIDG